MSVDELTAVEGSDRPLGLRIARIHLRTGALALARAELETGAGAGVLDPAGLLDLAEVRWRTGDLLGAAEAANAMLSSSAGEDLMLASVIAAEAAAALGRSDEANRLSAQALEQASKPVDSVFAGMPRHGPWPIDSPELPTETRTSAAPVPTWQHVQVGHAGASSPGLWDDDPAASGRGGPDPHLHLEAGRAALAAGQFDGAALHLAVALRLSPSLAPIVLEAVGEGAGPALALVRGDALRAVGYEWEARRAYAAAGTALAASSAPATGKTPAATSSPATAASQAIGTPPTSAMTQSEPKEGS